MKHPFIYEDIAANKYFYGRENDINKLNKYLSQSKNMYLFSKRSVGKTSLVKEIFRLHKNEFTCIYIDIFDITSPEDFMTRFLSGIAAAQKGNIKIVTSKLKKLFSQVTFSFSFNKDQSEISFIPHISDISFDKALSEAFSVLKYMSQKQQVVLAIDNFHQVSLFKDKKIDALLRTYIQEPYDISYIFLGDKRNKLIDLFLYRSPLFEMATGINLKSLDVNDIYEYNKNYLNISEGINLYLCELCDYDMKLIQHICHTLMNNYKKKLITTSYVDESINEVIKSKDAAFRVIYDSLTLPQKKAFKILTQYKQNIFSQDVLRKYYIEKGSLNSAIQQLRNKDLIDKEETKWFVKDRAFELWGYMLLC